jgi:glycosyltransferase involved in cell wall biosynthesis
MAVAVAAAPVCDVEALPRVAIAHDYLTQRGGAERVVLALLHAFPDAPVHTSFYESHRTFAEFGEAQVHTMALDRLRPLRRHHRAALPLLAPSFSLHRVDADVVVCSSSGWAHGVRTEARKVVYCHAPARWLYQSERYLRSSSPAVRLAASALRQPLLRWDRRAARSADLYVTQSRAVRDAIRDAYGIDAVLVPAPYTIDPHASQRAVSGAGEPGFTLCVARLLPYKNVDAVIAAFAMPSHSRERLVVVGRGPDEARLRAMAPPNVTLLGDVADDELRWLYANCAAVVSASYEDFGITPLEAAAFGKPVAVLRFGGFLDTLVEGVTGVFIDAPTAAGVAAALSELRRTPFDAAAIRAHAAQYSMDAFSRRMRELVLRLSAAPRSR